MGRRALLLALSTSTLSAARAARADELQQQQQQEEVSGLGPPALCALLWRSSTWRR